MSQVIKKKLKLKGICLVAFTEREGGGREREREATAKGAMPLITHSVTLPASERPSTQGCHCSDGCFRKRWRHVLSPTSQRGHAPTNDVSRDLIRLRVRHTGYHRTQTLTHRDAIRPRHSLSRIQRQTHRHSGIPSDP